MFVGGVPVAAFSPRRFPLPPIGSLTRASITSINADGFSAQDGSPVTFDPVGTPQYIVLNRQGFTNAGTATTYSENAIITTRMRVPFNSAISSTATDYLNANIAAKGLLDANRVALSTLAYSSDSIAGGSSAANNSTVTSPPPLAQWARPDRAVITNNTLRLEVCAAHRNARNGEQVACVVFTATDGTNTVTATASSSSVSGLSTDQQPVIVYGVNLNITSLNAGAITVNAKVYPWIGTAPLDSSTGSQGARASNPLAFVPQTYFKTAANPFYACVQSGASGGTASQTASTAAAAPFPDVASALAALVTAAGTASGQIVRLMAGTQAFGTLSGSGYASAAGAVYVEADPSTTPANAILNLAANTLVRVTDLWLRNVSVARTTTAQLTSNGTITLEGVLYTNAGNASISGATIPVRILGLTVSGTATGLLSSDLRLGRGINATGIGTVTGANITGCYFEGTSTATLTNAAYADGNNIIAFSKLMKLVVTPLQPANSNSLTSTVTGFAVLQNVFEYISATSNPLLRPSGDGATQSTDHFVLMNNTFAGYSGNGRGNIFYNEANAQASARTHIRHAFKGNIHVQINTKQDVFLGTDGNGTPQPTYAGQRVGGWAYMYGVDCQGELSQFADSAGNQNGIGSAFSQAYGGLGGAFGTSTSSATQDPKFVSPAATTGTSSTSTTAGAGGGNYAIQTGSPAASIVSTPVLKFDLTGTARKSTNDSAGAYVIAA